MPRTALLFAAALWTSIALAADPAISPQREKDELRFVELMRKGLRSPPKTPEEQKALKDELMPLMFSLAGVDPKNPGPDAQTKLSASQADILGRRDPALRDELLLQTQQFMCRSKQIEAKVGLQSVGRMQNDWLAEHKKFASTLKELDAEAIIAPRRYSYAVVAVTPKHFKVRATGKDDMAGDVWEVDEKGEPTNTTNLCQKFQGGPARP